MSQIVRLLAGSALALAAWAALAPSPRAQVRPQDMQFSLAPMLERVIPAVVSVRVAGERYRTVEIRPASSERREGPSPPRAPREPFRAGGSGVIVDAGRGLIVTNNHVIVDATTIMVALGDGRVFDARLVGRDIGTDVALLKIDAPDLPFVPLGNSDELKVGDIVVAIGNPFGLEGTATMGIVSALMRSDIGYEIFEDFIQIDASINPGNSGGALVNLKGELVAINTAVAGGGRSVGIGFAIPVNLARNVGEQLHKYGMVRRGGLGMLTQKSLRRRDDGPEAQDFARGAGHARRAGIAGRGGGHRGRRRGSATRRPAGAGVARLRHPGRQHAARHQPRCRGGVR